MMMERRTTVLLPGPGSYLGRRLFAHLVAQRDVHLRVLVEDRRMLGDLGGSACEFVEGDVLDSEILRAATAGADVAFFPLRLLATDQESVERRQRLAVLYRDACIDAGVKRIIFLGAHRLSEDPPEVLGSLTDVGETLSARPEAIQTIWFRAGLEVGSGSLLFEATRHLVEKAPILPTPLWMEARIPVISVRDLLDYLVAAIDLSPGPSLAVAIGAEPVSFREMLTTTARAMGRRRVYLPVPVSAMRLSPFILTLLSPFSGYLATRLLEIVDAVGRTPVRYSTDLAQRLFPMIAPVPFAAAVARALGAVEEERVISRWTDSLPSRPDTDLEAEISRSIFRDTRRESIAGIPPEQVFRAVTSIGGKRGWFGFNLLWRIRGLLDKLMGGIGDSAGRRSEATLRIGDYLDVWKVIDLQEDRRLLLEAHMKVGGRAWLEFRIEGETLVQTAYHYPTSLIGRLYWFSMLPFHAFIFPNMIRSIIRQARLSATSGT